MALGFGADSRVSEAMTGLDQRIERARLLYGRAVFDGGDTPLTEAD